MDPARLIRAARRHGGLSQRQLAERAGISRSTIGAIESGAHAASARVLDALLAAVDLDLVLAPRLTAAEDGQLRRHLRLSLTQRLRLATGESPVLAQRPRKAQWDELARLARCGVVVLDPPLAVGLWTPVPPVQRAVITVHGSDSVASDVVDVRQTNEEAPPSLVPIPMTLGCRVWVLPPGELARPSSEQAQLRHVDQLLHSEAPRDEAGRRRPAHRDPDAFDEDWRLLQTRSVLRRPDLRNGRAWRLDAPASLAQQVAWG